MYAIQPLHGVIATTPARISYNSATDMVKTNFRGREADDDIKMVGDSAKLIAHTLRRLQRPKNWLNFADYLRPMPGHK